MRILTNLLTAGAILAVATPAAAQYYGSPYSGYRQSYGYAQPNRYAQQPYGYAQNYGYAQYGYAQNYGYAVNTSVASQQCSAAVQNRLYNRTSFGSILGSLVGVPTNQGASTLGDSGQPAQQRHGSRARPRQQWPLCLERLRSLRGRRLWGDGLRLCESGRPVVPL